MAKGLVIGVAWYRPQDWNRLRAISVDRENIEHSHGQWLASANRAVRQFQRQGIAVRKVIVDLDELEAYCREHRIPINSEARSLLVSERVRLEESGGAE